MQSYFRASVRSGAALLGYSCPHRTMAACRCAGEPAQLPPCRGMAAPTEQWAAYKCAGEPAQSGFTAAAQEPRGDFAAAAKGDPQSFILGGS